MMTPVSIVKDFNCFKYSGPTGSDPGVNIRGRGLCQVLIEGRLTSCGHQHRTTFEGAEGAALRRRGIVAGAQMGKIGGDQALVQGGLKNEN